MVLYAYMCVFVHSRFVENPPIWSWDTNPSFLRWFYHKIPWECQVRHHQWLSYVPSAINSFASLGNYLGEIKCRNWNEVNSSKKTVEMGLFGHNSVPKLNTINMGNSASFPSVTNTILSTKRFRCCEISKIDFAADFCFWAEQRLNGT
jgi:hypothetical protein